MRRASVLATLAYIAVLNGPIYGLSEWGGSLVKLAGVPVFGLWLLGLLVTRRLRAPHAFHWLFIAFIMWTMLGLAWTVDPSATLLLVGRYMPMLLMSVCLWDLIRSEGQAEGAILMYVLGAYVVCGVQFIQYVRVGVNWEGRMQASDFNANDMAMALAVVVPIAWSMGMIAKTRRPWAARACAAYPVFATPAIILTASRGGFAGLAFAVLWCLLTTSRLRILGRFGLAGGAAVGLYLAATTQALQKSFERLATLLNPSQTGGLNGRLAAWQAGWQLFKEHPVAGTGGGTYEAALYSRAGTPYVIAHNTFLSVLVETGLVGLVLFAAVLFTVLRCALSRATGYRTGWLGSLLTWCACAAALSFEMRVQTWLLFTMIVATQNVGPRGTNGIARGLGQTVPGPPR